MRERDEVLEKFQEFRRVKLAERKQAYLCKSFMNCKHNARMRLKGKGHVGFCQNPEILNRANKGMFVCNDDETARRCHVFDCRNTEESVEHDFDDILRSPSRCGSEYPKLAMLIWFLQECDGPGRTDRLKYLSGRMASSFWKIATFKWW